MQKSLKSYVKTSTNNTSQICDIIHNQKYKSAKNVTK